MSLLSIIIPTYCEAENIHPVVTRIRAALDTRLDYEILFVDDNSPDETGARVTELQKQGAPVRLIVRRDERGLSSAILCGFHQARGDLLLCMDADLSHPPESILEMVKTLTENQADMVIGSRYISGGKTEKGWGMFRWLNSRVAGLLARPLTAVRDAMTGFFVMPRSVFEQARNLNPIGYKFALELIIKCPCRKVVEIPIFFADRQYGESKLNIREQARYLLHLKRLYDYRYGRASQFIQFCVIGASGVVVNLLTYLILCKLGLPLELAYAIAIGVSMTWNFLPNRYLTFDLTAHHPFWPQYGRFVATCTLGSVINWTVTMALSNEVVWFKAHVLIAALVGIASGTIFNFLISSAWAFHHARVHQLKSN
jgi:dolichol-phosphate mannosyltransferase